MKKFMNDRLKTEGKRLKNKEKKSWIIVLCSLFCIISKFDIIINGLN